MGRACVHATCEQRHTVDAVTLSILAFDPEINVVGAAVTSCVLAAGRRVLAVRPAVGAVATQAGSEITWGDEILDTLERGALPEDAIAPFEQLDVQLAAIDFKGRTAAFTGQNCTPPAGHHAGANVTVQVNTAALEDAVERMLDAFHAAVTQPLAERLVAALAASGDDARGKRAFSRCTERTARCVWRSRVTTPACSRGSRHCTRCIPMTRTSTRRWRH